jgi:hypothetical protein
MPGGAPSAISRGTPRVPTSSRPTINAFTLTIHLSGSDGSSITVHETTVFVMNGIGDITVSFDKLSLSCG